MHFSGNQLSYMKKLILSDKETSEEFKNEMLKKISDEEKFIYEDGIGEIVLITLNEHFEKVLDLREEKNDASIPVRISDEELFRTIKENYPSINKEVFLEILSDLEEQHLILSQDEKSETHTYKSYYLKRTILSFEF